jgi:hypothetical protein
MDKYIDGWMDGWIDRRIGKTDERREGTGNNISG